jgi:cellulase
MFQLPSNVKPGMYVLRTEIVAMHSNSASYLPKGVGGPQFFVHCFNLKILGGGAATSAGVKFPGGYRPNELGMAFNLYN